MKLEHEGVDSVPRSRCGRLGRGPRRSRIDTKSCGRQGVTSTVVRLGLLVLVVVSGCEGWLAAGATGAMFAAWRGSGGMTLQSRSRALGLGEREGNDACDLVFSTM